MCCTYFDLIFSLVSLQTIYIYCLGFAADLISRNPWNWCVAPTMKPTPKKGMIDTKLKVFGFLGIAGILTICFSDIHRVRSDFKSGIWMEPQGLKRGGNCWWIFICYLFQSPSTLETDWYLKRTSPNLFVEVVWMLGNGFRFFSSRTHSGSFREACIHSLQILLISENKEGQTINNILLIKTYVWYF